MNQRRVPFGVAAVIGATLLAACGSASGTGSATGASTTKPTTATTSTAPVPQQVAAILGSISSQAPALERSAGWLQLGVLYGTAAKQLKALTFPESSKADAKKLIALLDQLNVDAGQVPTDGTANFLNDQASANAAGVALQDALGLTPTSTTATT